jgi:uncharacterized membrane protein YebE (DUF533 family)
MDAIDILGSILGHKSGKRGGGGAGDVFGNIFKGGSRSRSAPAPAQPPQPNEIQQEAKELEDLLNVASERQTHSSSGTRGPSLDRESTGIPAPRSRPGGDPPGNNERALVLVRAMINAAKSDGRLDQAEQDKIVNQLHDPSPDAIRFLREEFQRPVNLQEFVASVPIGMEQQVYTMSLAAIDLDTGGEAKYLMQLAESLRIPMNVREQIHKRLGAPSIY